MSQENNTGDGGNVADKGVIDRARELAWIKDIQYTLGIGFTEFSQDRKALQDVLFAHDILRIERRELRIQIEKYKQKYGDL